MPPNIVKKFVAEEFIRESNAIENIYGDEEIKQSLMAWKLLDGKTEISHYDICRVQKVITFNQKDLEDNWRGYYRSVSGINVSVGGHQAPPAGLVDSLMGNWLVDLPKMEPLIAHIRFESIHPFVDGNGRTGRMLYWWQCQQRGIHPFFHTKKLVKNYYRLFEPERVKRLQDANWAIDWTGEKPK